jgi:hypothetical protein
MSDEIENDEFDYADGNGTASEEQAAQVRCLEKAAVGLRILAYHWLADKLRAPKALPGFLAMQINEGRDQPKGFKMPDNVYETCEEMPEAYTEAWDKER